MKPAVPILLVMIAIIAMIATGVSAQTFETEPVWSEPETFYGYFGSTLAAAGDVDGNGWDDVIVGGPFHTDCCPSFQQYGAVFLYSGSTVGLLPSIAWFEVGSELGTTLGEDTARAGDVNGDGFADVVFNSGSGFGNGTHQVHVRFGSSGGLASGWNFDSGMLYGALGPAVDGAGDVNGSRQTRARPQVARVGLGAPDKVSISAMRASCRSPPGRAAMRSSTERRKRSGASSSAKARRGST